MGKGKYDDRPTFMVDLIDTEKLNEICKQILALQYTGSIDNVGELADWEVDGPLVIAKDNESKAFGEDRQFAIVCTEGVGYGADEYGRIQVPLISHKGFSSQYVEIYAKILWDLRTGEQVDLADHVRTFGDRLETNFSIWYRRFTSPITVKPLV